MNEQQFEDFAKMYPALFEKAEITAIHTGQGWNGIIETMCDVFYSECAMIESRIAYETQQPDPNYKILESLHSKLHEHATALPVIKRVKEKFGRLRIYVDSTDPAHTNYLRFAEAMSTRICEICGAPGKPHNDGWVKTLCEAHITERTTPTKIPTRSPRWPTFEE